MPLIECKLRETEQTIGGTVYSFRTNAEGRHVAIVTDARHIDCFLASSDVYQLADEADAYAVAAMDRSEPEKAIVNFPMRQRGRRRS